MCDCLTVEGNTKCRRTRGRVGSAGGHPCLVQRACWPRLHAQGTAINRHGGARTEPERPSRLTPAVGDHLHRELSTPEWTQAENWAPVAVGSRNHDGMGGGALQQIIYMPPLPHCQIKAKTWEFPLIVILYYYILLYLSIKFAAIPTNRVKMQKKLGIRKMSMLGTVLSSKSESYMSYVMTYHPDPNLFIPNKIPPNAIFGEA